MSISPHLPAFKAENVHIHITARRNAKLKLQEEKKAHEILLIKLYIKTYIQYHREIYDPPSTQETFYGCIHFEKHKIISVSSFKKIKSVVFKTYDRGPRNCDLKIGPRRTANRDLETAAATAILPLAYHQVFYVF